MNLTFHQLQIFVAVADRQSFTRATEDLVLTQPAVSMQIKVLERTVGMPLLDHAGKHIRLTEAGQEFYTRATRILELGAETADTMRSPRGMWCSRTGSHGQKVQTDTIASHRDRQFHAANLNHHSPQRSESNGWAVSEQRLCLVQRIPRRYVIRSRVPYGTSESAS